MLNNEEKTLLLDCIDDARETCLRNIRRQLIEVNDCIIIEIYEERIKEIDALKSKMKSILSNNFVQPYSVI